MNCRLHILSLILFLLPWQVIVAQFVGKPFVINYDKRVYGGDNQNWSVAVGPDGLTYFGNDRGLLEFDGANWKLYSMPERGIVRSVSVGDDGNIYVGSYQEFGYWSRDKCGELQYFSLSDQLLKEKILHNDEIWRILIHNGKTYFQSFSKIFIYDGKEVNVLSPTSSMVLLIKAHGRLFIHQVGQGLFEIIDDTFKFIQGSETFASNEIKVILAYEGGQFLVGVTGRGMYVFDGTSFKQWENPLNQIFSSLELNNGLSGNNRLVIGTIGSGIYILDEKGILQEHISTTNFLQNNTVLALAFDPSGNIWACLDRGIDLINLSSSLDFYLDPSGTMGSVYAAVAEGTGLLVGTNQGLYRYRFVEGEGYADPHPVPGLSGQVWDLKNIDGEIICGHNTGTYRIEGDQVTRISSINGGFESKRISDPTKDYLLQSSYSAFSVFRRESGHWQFDHAVRGFNEPISNFENDHLGNIWGAHATKGIFRLRLSPDLTSVESSEFYGKGKGLGTDLNAGLVKIENRIVFPSGTGLYTWDDLNDTVILYNQLNSKVGEFANSRQIIRARENFYWFIHNNEIALFRITGFSAELVYRYDLSMQGLYMNNRFPKIVSINEGLHLICLDNGFALFDETSLRTLPPPAHVYVRSATAISRNGDQLCLPIASQVDEVRIPNRHRSVTFYFSSGTGYRHPLYRTMLKGLDNDWNEWSNQSFLTLNRLPAGQYALSIVSMNINGLSGDPAVYRFRIVAPWYASTIAWVIYVLIIIGLALFFRILFLKRLRLHKMQIERQEINKRREEMIRAEQEVIRLKNEKLEAEVNFKNIQLADYTMSIIKRNEQLIRIRDEFIRQAGDKNSGNSKALYERMLKLFDRHLSSEDDWKTFETHFDQAHQDFISRLKANYPGLTQSDLKLCAYLRLNISSKEIAHLLNISLRGVEVRRYRLRKRLNISTEENLYEFLLSC